MPIRVVVLGDPRGWHVGRLLAALCSQGHQATAVCWSELSCEVAGKRAEMFFPPAIAEAQIVVVRGMPGGRLEDVIFRMDLLGRLESQGTRIVNSPRALEGAIDKYLSLTRLAAAGVAVPRTIVAQDADAIQQAWQSLGGDCVLKPLFGSGGRGIQRLMNRQAIEPLLETARQSQPAGAVAYLQEFVPHNGWDVRILLVGERVFSIRRVSENGDWRTNIALGARPEAFSPPETWIDVARQAARELKIEIAGVDLLPASDGRLFVLEINAVPGWRGLETATTTTLGREVVRYLEALQSAGC